MATMAANTTIPAMQVAGSAGNVVLFLVLVICMAVLCLYWLLASSRLAGVVVSLICNKLLLPEGDSVSIGAINYSSVQGRIALGSVVYTSKNISVSLVRCLVTVRYWRRHVQTFANIRASRRRSLSCIRAPRGGGLFRPCGTCART